METLFEGTITESAIYPREIFGKALEKKAVFLILVHNHPSGDVTPSKEDLKLTKNLILAGLLLQCKIIDHIIIGKNGYFSMAEKGIIENLEKEILGILK
uniref:MPN domain-containing protein n=1 Tax=Thermodesulfobacterium geofontis TaxID=1295609 RepID=A0A7V4N2L8_9BACT